MIRSLKDLSAPGALKGRRVFVIRMGAYGDMICMVPFLRWLRREEARVVLCTSERGRNVLHGCPYVDSFEFIPTDTIPQESGKAFLLGKAEENRCDTYLDFCGCIENALSPQAHEPLYKMPKGERHARCNVNYYEQAFHYAGASWALPFLTSEDLRPELSFTSIEKRLVRGFLDTFKETCKASRVMIVCWTGSGPAKRYPWMEDVIEEALSRHPDLCCVVVGDFPVDLRELVTSTGGRVYNKMKGWSFRMACAAIAYADLLVSPDTGILHASGCWPTPKIGLLGANTRENLTKHFLNDFSLEADAQVVGCAPCHRMIHDGGYECEVDEFSTTSWCMYYGIPRWKVADRVDEALASAVPAKEAA